MTLLADEENEGKRMILAYGIIAKLNGVHEANKRELEMRKKNQLLVDKLKETLNE